MGALRSRHGAGDLRRGWGTRHVFHLRGRQLYTLHRTGGGGETPGGFLSQQPRKPATFRGVRKNRRENWRADAGGESRRTLSGLRYEGRVRGFFGPGGSTRQGQSGRPGGNSNQRFGVSGAIGWVVVGPPRRTPRTFRPACTRPIRRILNDRRAYGRTTKCM